MKLTIEPRTTTQVSFVDCTAEVRVEWRCRAEYHAHNALDPIEWRARTRYSVRGLTSAVGIPSSQLIVLEQGIPLAVVQTAASTARDRFESEEVDDPFVVISDRVAGVDKSKLAERVLVSGATERTWTEIVDRRLRIENRTGKLLRLAFTIVDDPGDGVRFERAEPAVTRTAAPEYGFDIELGPDGERTQQIVLQVERRETLRASHAPVREAPSRLFKSRTEAPMVEGIEED